MLRKIAAALVAVTVLGAPLMLSGTASAAGAAGTNGGVNATTQQVIPAKPGMTVIKKHRTHVRHVRHGRGKHVKVTRHGKAHAAKAHSARHHVTHIKKSDKVLTRQGTRSRKAPAA
jgi:hypothetical protein